MLRSILLVVCLLVATSHGFVSPNNQRSVAVATSKTASFAFGKKKQQDFSDIESRDMTREEMVALNKKNEEIMNMELSMMTGVSLVFSLPILYLLYVAFFSD